MSRPKPIKAIHSDYYKQISYNLKYFRTVREITQAELATLANTSEKYISQIESLTYVKSPSLEWLFDIADALKIHPYMLFKPLLDLK